MQQQLFNRDTRMNSDEKRVAWVLLSDCARAHWSVAFHSAFKETWPWVRLAHVLPSFTGALKVNSSTPHGQPLCGRRCGLHGGRHLGERRQSVFYIFSFFTFFMSGEPGQLRESLRHVTLPRQRLAAASVRISRSWVKTPGVSDVWRVHRAL